MQNHCQIAILLWYDFTSAWIYMVSKKHYGKADQLTLTSGSS